MRWRRSAINVEEGHPRHGSSRVTSPALELPTGNSYSPKGPPVSSPTSKPHRKSGESDEQDTERSNAHRFYKTVQL